MEKKSTLHGAIAAAFFCGFLFVQCNQATAQHQAEPSVDKKKAGAYLSPPTLSAILAIGDTENRLAAMHEAIQYYQRFTADHPGNIQALQHLGKLYSWTNKIDQAIVAYQTAINLDKSNVALKNELARIYRWSQRFSEAEMLYKSVLESDPKDHHALEGLAITYQRMGDYPNAKVFFDRALALYPNSAELNKEQGVLFARQGRYSEAIASLKKAIQLSPKMMDAYTTLGDVYFWSKQFELALEEYKQAMALDPNSYEMHLMIAKIYRQLGSMTLAEGYASKALRINPVGADAIELAADIKQSKKFIQLDDAIHYLEFAAIMFVLAMTMIGYWKNRRMIHRRHRLISYTILVAMPLVVLASLTILIAEAKIKNLLDVEFLESVSNSIAIILLGIVYLIYIFSAGKSGKDKRDVILAIGAHPDDIELGCGGYILRAKAQGAKVYGLTLTRGERGTDKANVRAQEAHAAAHFMGLDDYWLLDFPDGHLQEKIREAKEKIEEVIRKLAPTVVLMHNPYDHHSDHKATYTAAKEAARLVPTALCYESIGTPNEFNADYYVDISDYMNEMLRVIGLHKSQAHKSYMDPVLLKGRASHRGIQCSVPYAMAFQVVRILN